MNETNQTTDIRVGKKEKKKKKKDKYKSQTSLTFRYTSSDPRSDLPALLIYFTQHTENTFCNLPLYNK